MSAQKLFKFEFTLTTGEADLFWQMLAESISNLLVHKTEALVNNEPPEIIKALDIYVEQEKAFRDAIFKSAVEVPGTSDQNLLFTIPES